MVKMKKYYDVMDLIVIKKTYDSVDYWFICKSKSKKSSYVEIFTGTKIPYMGEEVEPLFAYYPLCVFDNNHLMQMPIELLRKYSDILKSKKIDGSVEKHSIQKKMAVFSKFMGVDFI